MIYALGRGLQPSDMPVVRSIVAGAARRGYRLSAIIEGIAGSVPFRMRVKPVAAQGTLATSAVAHGHANEGALATPGTPKVFQQPALSLMGTRVKARRRPLEHRRCSSN